MQNLAQGLVVIKRGTLLVAGLVTAAAMLSEPARASDLYSLLLDAVENHDRIRAAKSDLAAAQSGIREAESGWYPELQLDAARGHQKRRNPSSNDTSLNYTDTSVSVTQRLYDFGSTDAGVVEATVTRDQSVFELTQTRQDLILEGIAAYVDVISSFQRVELAKQSEDNIKQQAELEDARVDGGAGFSTDVLQAKTELAEAQSRRTVAEGELLAALSRYRAVFLDEPTELFDMAFPRVPDDLLPIDLASAIRVGLSENPGLRSVQLQADINRQQVRSTRADEFFPTIDAVVESSYDDNLDGTLGAQVEHSARVELSFPFNLGFTAVDTLKASKYRFNAAQQRFGDELRTTEQDIRLAWHELETARKNNDVRNIQVGLAARFVELAREEREAGRRDLLDVLSGETRLINAQIDAVRSKGQAVIAAFRLLNQIGRLELAVID